MEEEDYVHVDICEEALTNEVVFNTFKSDPKYQHILEHTSVHYGREYAKLIINEYSDYASKLDWEKLKENDSIGKPNVINFPSLSEYNKSPNYSPSTLYYVYRGLDIIHKLLQDGKDINILEIGGGYGGQCKLIMDMCEMLNISINSYGIIDLKYPSRLQNKYLSKFTYSNISFYEYGNITDFSVFKNYNKFFSNYALTEFDKHIQDSYVDNIIKYIEKFYILCNLPITNPLFSTNTTIVDAKPFVHGRYHKIITN
jgi:hypothetical protein